jgi:hypothetical protein
LYVIRSDRGESRRKRTKLIGGFKSGISRPPSAQGTRRRMGHPRILLKENDASACFSTPAICSTPNRFFFISKILLLDFAED